MKQIKLLQNITNDYKIEPIGYELNGMFIPLDQNNRHYLEIQKLLQDNEAELIPQYTDEDVLNKAKQDKINELKQKRDKKIKEIVVTLENGKQLNGDELAQTRFARAIQALPDDTTTIDWIDYSNKTIKLTKLELQEALTKAGQEETNIYVNYNMQRQEVLNATSICEIYPELEKCNEV